YMRRRSVGSGVRYASRGEAMRDNPSRLDGIRLRVRLNGRLRRSGRRRARQNEGDAGDAAAEREAQDGGGRAGGGGARSVVAGTFGGGDGAATTTGRGAQARRDGERRCARDCVGV